MFIDKQILFRFGKHFFIGSIALLSGLAGCSDRQDSNGVYFASMGNAPVTVTKPVHRDLEAIKKSGVIRLLTRYNSCSYFLRNGSQHGFEYDFFHRFAEEQGLRVEVVIIRHDENPIDLLNSGKGDVIAANYVITPQRKKYIDFTRPYNLVNQVIVLPDSRGSVPQTVAEMEPLTISVRRRSSYYQSLKRLINEGYPIKIRVVPEDYDTEALIHDVQTGDFQATVADNNLLKAAMTYMDGIASGPVISRNDTVAWGIRKNSPELKEAMNRFLSKHFRLEGPNEPPKRSAFLNILRHKYFQSERPIYAEHAQTASKYAGILSPYDKLIQPIADSAGIDWKMIAAMIAQESKFDPDAISWAGAVGLMQVLPQFSLYPKDSLMNVSINIHEGIRILEEQLHQYSYMDSTDQWKFALATYNAGPGHITDARRLVIDRYENPNDWNNVAHALVMLMQRKYYKDARYGFCRGIETVNYVEDIIRRYHMYQTITELAANNERAVSPVVLGLTNTIP